MKISKLTPWTILIAFIVSMLGLGPRIGNLLWEQKDKATTKETESKERDNKIENRVTKLEISYDFIGKSLTEQSRLLKTIVGRLPPKQEPIK